MHTDAYRDVRAAKERPTQPAMPPSTHVGASGLNATQLARKSLEIEERRTKALEDLRDIARASAEAMAPVLLSLAQGLGPALLQASKDLRELGEKLLAALEYSPLDTHDD
jgi:hypothetical protein